MGCWIPSMFPALLPPFSPHTQPSLGLGDVNFASIASQSLPRVARKTGKQLLPATASPNIHPKSPASGKGPSFARADGGTLSWELRCAHTSFLQRPQRATARDAFPTPFNLTPNPGIASEPRREGQAGNAGRQPAGTAAGGGALGCTKGAVILTSASRDRHSAV